MFIKNNLLFLVIKKVRMKRGIFFVVLAGVLLVSPFVFAGNFIAFQGNVKEGGSALSSGNLSVRIYDAQTGGNLVYDSGNDFDGAISSGEYDVMLGNGSNELNLNYGQKYFLEMFVNGEGFTFNGNSRQVFESAVGNISYINIEANLPASYVNKSGGTNWIGNNLEGILDTIYSWISGVNSTENFEGLGFVTNDTNAGNICGDNEVLLGNGSCYNSSLFGTASGDIEAVNTPGDYLTGGGTSGSVDLYLNETKLNESIDARGNFSGEGNSSWNQSLADSLYAKLLDGNQINGTQDFNGGWLGGGLSIVGGSLFAQTVYVYNLSSLAVNELSVNGSLLPDVNFDNSFDIGSSVLRWRNLYLGGDANVSGNLSLGGGMIAWNATGRSYIYYNGSMWQVLGSGASSGIWSESNGTASYDGNVSVAGNITVSSIDVTTGGDVCIAGGNCLSTVGGGVGSGWSNSSTTVTTSLDVKVQNDSGTQEFFVNSTSGDVDVTGNLSLGGKINFLLGAVIQNILTGWVSVNSNLSVEGDLNVSGKLNLGNGTIWYNDSDAKFYYYNGSAWAQIGTGDGSGNTTFYVGERMWTQYVANSSDGPGDFNVTGTDWTTTRGVAIPYQVLNESGSTIWRLRFNIEGTMSSTASFTGTISGVNFSNNHYQSLSANIRASTVFYDDVRGSYTVKGTSDFTILSSSTNFNQIYVAGDVELDSKPTWADEPDDASTVWTQNTTTNEIYYNTANVGINKSDPEATLHVAGDVIIEI